MHPRESFDREEYRSAPSPHELFNYPLGAPSSQAEKMQTYRALRQYGNGYPGRTFAGNQEQFLAQGSDGFGIYSGQSPPAMDAAPQGLQMQSMEAGGMPEAPMRQPNQHHRHRHSAGSHGHHPHRHLHGHRTQGAPGPGGESLGGDNGAAPQAHEQNDFAGGAYSHNHWPGQSTVGDSVRTVLEQGRQLGLSRDAMRAAVASMIVESKGDPHAKGDYSHGQPTSFGLFQLHRGGELTEAHLTPEQAYDPVTNARVALTQFRRIQGEYHDPGSLAAAAQRPRDRAGYARAVDQNLRLADRLIAEFQQSGG